MIKLVIELLRELGEEGDETGDLNFSELIASWHANEKYHCAFIAYEEDGTAVGVATNPAIIGTKTFVGTLERRWSVV